MFFIYMIPLLFNFFNIMVMLSVAFFTLFERKIMGHFHNRSTPNKIFFFGIF